MTDTDIGFGHNRPPEPTPLERANDLIPACDEWTAHGPLKNEDEARRLSEFLTQLRLAREKLRAAYEIDAKPFKDGLLVIDTLYGLPEKKLDMAIERIAGSKKTTGLLAAWMADVQRRLDEEAAAKRRAAEDAQREAERASDRAALSGTIDDAVEVERATVEADEATKAVGRRPPRAHVKGDLAPKAIALHDYWSAAIHDWPAARRHYRTEARVVKAYDDAVQAAADADARAKKNPALAPKGVEFIKRQQAQ